MSRAAEAAVLQALSAMLARHFGWSGEAMPRHTLERALHRRMQSTEEVSAPSYLRTVLGSETERTALLAEVLVHETSFFRDDAVFTHLLHWSLDWLRTHTGVLRVLSAPCATGEEPYSIAAQLWQAGVPLDRFTIDAVDISEKAIRSTRQAVYQNFALRNIANPAAEPFLQSTPEGWQVVDVLRHRVHPRTVNLVEPDALRHAGELPVYDLILSRNLLLYLHPAGRLAALSNLHGALAPEGRLILGTADWGADVEARFALERPFETFAARPLHTPPAMPVAAQEPPAPPAPRPRADDAVDRLYREALRAHRSGRVHEAVWIGRKALYLQPAHLPSLELLGTIWQGAPPRVRHALAARLQRARGRGGQP